jgi:hypothetical protein
VNFGDRSTDDEVGRPLVTKRAYRVWKWSFLGPLFLFLVMLALFAVGVFEAP